MNLSFTSTIPVSSLSAGTLVYYADATAIGNQYLHALQVAKVMVSNDKSFVLDNGKRFNPETNLEITRNHSPQGSIYPYTPTVRAMVAEAQDKLYLVNEVLNIDFTKLSVQQLSMIKDVARGAFTQVTMPTPCGGGCGDTVKVAGLDIEVEPALKGLGSSATFYGVYQPEVTAPIAFNDASYELSDSDEDDTDAADDMPLDEV